MKKAVQYGAGNIGRGFIGQLLSQSGYEVVFIDVDTRLVDALNQDRKYPVRVVSDKGNYEITVENVSAVNGMDMEAAAREISEADIMATAVGVNILPRIAPTIAKGLQRRWQSGIIEPLNIIICENLIDADKLLRDLISKELEESEQELLKFRVGFVEASIGRMVPVMTPEMQEGNILRICVEEYDKLPVDSKGFVGDIPAIRNMIPYTPFEFYIRRKLFIHNMGHAIAAYLGSLKGCRFIWEAIGDEYIRSIVKNAMNEAALAISQEHGTELCVLTEHVNDLIARFGNQQLGDTVERVGRDLQRKLSSNDRLAGAVKLCRKNGVIPMNICIGIAAALHFPDSVPTTGKPDFYEPEDVLEEVCRLERKSTEWQIILCCHNMISLLKNMLDKPNMYDCFEPGKAWLDIAGRPIQAHGGGILFHKGVYYWYGEDKSGVTISGKDIICGYRMDAIGVRCYSSADLYNWKDEGLVLKALTDNPEHDLYAGGVLERPKVIYNEKTGKFVLWLHVDRQDYSYAGAGVAVADSPTGPFRYLESIRPNQNDSRDITVFKDDDGKAYLLHSSEWNKTLYISELTEDFRNVSGRYVRIFIGCSREAPAVLKHRGKYFIITSGCTGWDPNEAECACSDSMMGEWTVKGNPCIGEDSDKTYFTQSTFALPIPGSDRFIMMFDRWHKENLKDSRYVWLPMTVDGDRITVEWKDKWEL